MYGEEERCIQGYGGKPRGKRPLGRLRRRWLNIKMDLQLVIWGGGGMDWNDLAPGRDKWRALANTDCDTVNITHTQTIVSYYQTYFMDII